MTTSEHTYCGLTLDAIRSRPQWHAAALAEARASVQTAEAFARVDQCSQETLDRARDRLEALEGALSAEVA